MYCPPRGAVRPRAASQQAARDSPRGELLVKLTGSMAWVSHEPWVDAAEDDECAGAVHAATAANAGNAVDALFLPPPGSSQDRVVPYAKQLVGFQPVAD